MFSQFSQYSSWSWDANLLRLQRKSAYFFNFIYFFGFIRQKMPIILAIIQEYHE